MSREQQQIIKWAVKSGKMTYYQLALIMYDILIFTNIAEFYKIIAAIVILTNCGVSAEMAMKAIKNGDTIIGF